MHLNVITRESSHMQLKQSLYKSEQVLSVPGCFVSQISRQLAHDCGKVVTPKHRPHLPPGDIPCMPIRERVDPRAIVRPKGLCKWKIPIQPATFQLVAQCLNHLHHHVLPIAKQNISNQHHRQMCNSSIQEARYKTRSYCTLHSHNIRHPEVNSPNCRHDWVRIVAN